MNPLWLTWAKKMQSIAQSGLAYSENPYDRDRYEQIRDLSVEILQHYTEVEEEKIRTLFAAEEGYQTPKVDVRAAIFREDEILLIREKIDGRWSMPGGWADVDLSIRENIRKEAMEEAGCDVRVKRIVAVLDRQRHVRDAFPFSVYKVIVECDYIRNEFPQNIETSEFGFFNLDNLPELSPGRTTKTQLELCFAARKETAHEVVFD
ncbi:MAG: NUDIX hydrolase [Fusobacteriaceae bacterium]|jgi:ADP-ribose pyrophosphatase YjhB (NUDIX family)|nr:NUDIX hydrolase [Fusobacteriaceae bacterium]